MRWRSYIAVVLGVAIVGLAAAALANFTIDVRGVYARADAMDSYVQRYVTTLMTSEHGLVSVPYERAVKLRLAQVRLADCAITGSSHEMRANLQTLPPLKEIGCATAINLAVSGGTYEDLLIALGTLLEHNKVRTVIAGIGPWALRSNADSRWASDHDLLASARRTLGLGRTAQIDGKTDRLLNLINGSYLRRNLMSIVERQGDVGFPPIRDRQAAGGALLPGEHVMLADGSLTGEEETVGEVGDGSYKIAMPFIERRLVRELEQVIGHLAGQGIRVVPMLTPYHPKVWQCHAAAVCAALTAVEQEIRTLARAFGLTVIGSYDPRRFGLDAPAFGDDTHLLAKSLKAVAITQR